MDLETENKIAAMLLKEAAEMRRQAEQEGVLAYLKKPSVRVRPNSWFLTYNVLGVEQANKVVEVNEMWRARQKELELDNRSQGRSRDGAHHGSRRHGINRNAFSTKSHSHDLSNRHGDEPSSSNRNKNGYRYRPDDEGLKDDEVEEFLRSRVKRGRGSVGSRMDETGPYLSQLSDHHDDRFVTSDQAREKRWSRVSFGLDRPPWKSKESSNDDDDDESEDNHDIRKKSKKSSSESSKKNPMMHDSKEKTRDKRRRRGINEH